MFSPAIALPQRMLRAHRPTRKIVPVPAPYGGWNARDAKSEMEPQDAVVLDNFLPDLQGVQQRRGFAQQASGISGSFVETLISYNKSGATAQLFAAGPSAIYNATAAGTASVSLSGLSNGRWQHTTFGTSGGHFLVICNGVDSVRNYDGSSWTTPSITGVSSSTLINVAQHKSRLWFVKQSTLSAYYLDTLSIAGAATEFPMSQLFSKGGELIGIASWSRDGGAGPDDYLVFVTSKGQVAVYAGNDPDTVDDWSLVDVFDGPPPIGYRCLIKLGADLCILSQQGLLPLPQYLGKSSADVASLALTNKISAAFQAAVRSSGDNFGWSVTEYPRENLLIINVPITERSTQHQYVINLKTGAACRFTGMNAGCWAVKKDTLYFGGNNGKVYAYGGTGVYDDAGSPVSAVAVQAFQRYGTPLQKHFKMARPLVAGPEGYAPAVVMLLDFNSDTLPTFNPPSYEVVGPYWDEEDWDSVLWASGLVVNNLWQTVTGAGVTGAIAMASKVTTPLIWNQTDLLFEVGEAL